MVYFKDCHTLEQVKIRFRTLAKVFHPDCGGTDELMVKLNDEYAVACNTIMSSEGLTSDEAQEGMKLSEEYRRVIEQITPLPGIKIEVVGNWIWVTGNTYPVRQQLKLAGLYFASKKQAWYYRADEYKTTSSKKSLDEIRSKYGSEQVPSRPHSHVIE